MVTVEAVDGTRETPVINCLLVGQLERGRTAEPVERTEPKDQWLISWRPNSNNYTLIHRTAVSTWPLSYDSFRSFHAPPTPRPAFHERVINIHLDSALRSHQLT